MSDDNHQTKPDSSEFDFSTYAYNTLFHDRRTRGDRRSSRSPASGHAGGDPHTVPTERRQKKERRRRIDPTTFDKQYTDDELEFMNAMQRFKEQACKAFPSHGEVLAVASKLGYRRLVVDADGSWDAALELESPTDDESANVET